VKKRLLPVAVVIVFVTLVVLAICNSFPKQGGPAPSGTLPPNPTASTQPVVQPVLDPIAEPIAQPTPFARKYKYKEAGLRAGMTKDEVTSALAGRDTDTRFLLHHCGDPEGNHQYLCRYNGNDGDWIYVYFLQQDDRLVGFSMRLHYEGPLSDTWKMWHDDIGKELGVRPMKEADNPDEYTLKHSEWVVMDASGNRVEKVRLDAMTENELMVNYEATP
jgi:hypothetical protein